MKIQKIYTENNSRKVTLAHKNMQVKSSARQYTSSTYMENAINIPFQAMTIIKPKRVNIEQEHNKLLKQLSKIIETQQETTGSMESIEQMVLKHLARFKKVMQRQREICTEIEVLQNNSLLTLQQKQDALIRYEKEVKALLKEQDKTPPVSKEKVDDSIDIKLVQKFKMALLKGNYNLDQIYKDHYSSLNDMHKIQEIVTDFPQIKIPPSPVEVISKKVADSLGREFYERLKDLLVSNDSKDEEEAKRVVSQELSEICVFVENKYGLEASTFLEKLVIPVFNQVLDKIAQSYDWEGFSNIPYKNGKVLIPLAKEDVDLLKVNYDDFVLFVLRKMYIDGEKSSNIVYEENGNVIPVKSLSNTKYKIEKPSEKIKQFVNMARNIKYAQRDYEHFNDEQLKARLNYFADTEFGSNNYILSKIVDFDSVEFTTNNKNNLVSFLRQLDLVEDNKLSIEDAISKVEEEGYVPEVIEKENIEIDEKVRLFEQKHKEMQKLTSLQKQFDDMINLLYANNLSFVANDFIKYRPTNLNKEQVTVVNEIQSIINKNVDSEGKNILNKVKLETTLSRYDAYKFMINDFEPDEQVVKDSLDFATGEDGIIDIDKAGQYFINYNILDKADTNPNLIKNKEVLDEIKRRLTSSDDNAKVIQYLCKFDDYETMLPEEKARLGMITEIFDIKDPVAKNLLKYIIERDYSKIDTTVSTRLNNTNDKFNATITANAKQQVMAKYKFPISLDFLLGFENALVGGTARSFGDSGIKTIGRNNKALPYDFELKIAGHDDRLFAKKDYIFDVYAEKGLH